MDKLGGYTGNILKVDLTTRSITSIPLSSELATKFTGGAGLNAWLAYDYIQPHTPAFSPGNALVFGAGPLVGTLAPAAGKTNFTSKSPLTNFIGTSGSGHMGMLKFAGYDHVIVTGKADSPVYLEIGDDAKIREAGHLWGKDTWETTDAIWNELGRKHAVASIGPAGENLVSDASIIANKYSAFAKTGMGAVMGSKNLKAIVAYGSQGISIADPDRFVELANSLCRKIMDNPLIGYFRTLGTLVVLEDMIKGSLGSISYKNCQRAANEELLKSFDLNALHQMMEQHGNISCMACPVGCKHFMRIRNGPAMGISCAVAPVAYFGGTCAIEGWIETYKCAELCGRLGIDYGSASNLVAMAIELYQRGVVDKRDTGGLELDWQPGVVQDLLQSIAYRKGFGNVLADGLIEAPRHIGRGAEYYALHYKGGGNAYDPRPGLNIFLASVLTNVIGHTSGVVEVYGQPRDIVQDTVREMGMSEEDMERVFSGPGEYNFARLTRWAEDYGLVMNSLGICAFDPFQRLDINVWAEAYSAATGIRVDAAGLLKAAGRGADIRKAFNNQEGASRRDDTMPSRFLTESLKVGEKVYPPVDKEHLDRVITEYYEERGWDPHEGTLAPQRLAELTGQATG